MRRLLHSIRLALVALCFCYATTSYSITVVRPVPKLQTLKTPQVTTDVARRAHNDVQVRKLLNLFAAKKVDSGTLYERLRSMKGSR